MLLGRNPHVARDLGHPLAVRGGDPVTVRKDDAPAATQAATTILAASLAFSDGGGLIQTTSG